MKNYWQRTWLWISKDDLETERIQCDQEGKLLLQVDEEFERLIVSDLTEDANQKAAEELLDRTALLSIREDYPFEEPSDLDGIRLLRPAASIQLPAMRLTDLELLDKVHGAWTGRSIGCLLGKPVEGWRRDKMYGYLKELNRWPLNDFFRYDSATSDVIQKYHLDDNQKTFGDMVSAMPEDDDMNYTTTGLAIFQRYGNDFTPDDVASFWLSDIPILRTCTAERVAYRNFTILVDPPYSASYRNPYREWIGAQIRADLWGYAAAGNPELAAEFAWRDASVSHVKNGIYGEMWAAAMIAAAFCTDDILTIIRSGLQQIPVNCRLSDAIESVLEWREVEVDYDTAVYRVHELWDEKRSHDWCHTIPNAMIVTIGLLWGENDYAQSICKAVQSCFDTDCNGATTGSILGIIHGKNQLPSRWIDVINDTLHTGVAGYHTVSLLDMAKTSIELIHKVQG